MKKTAWCLQQVPFEGPGIFRSCLERRGFEVNQTVVPAQGLPQGPVDFLLIMGGPMSVNDPAPWIAKEREFIERMVSGGIPVLGVCFGAQLLTGIFGGTVAAGRVFEIGMVPVFLTSHGKEDAVFGTLSDPFSVFQWHGEGIRLGSTGVPLASSADFPVQAVRFMDFVYGLLFHPEIQLPDISIMCRECPQDVIRGGVSPEDMERQTREHLPSLHRFADRMVGHLTGLPAPFS